MYKLLLCWRYLRTRWIALASIVSVTLGVATLIVVNSVMDGFTTLMQERMHGILSDLVVETRSTAGLSNPDYYMKRIHDRLGDQVEGITSVVTLPAMMTFDVNGSLHTQQVNLIGIDDKTYASVSDFSKYLLHPENQQKLDFNLREDGYAPDRDSLQPAGWEHRRYAQALKKSHAEQLREFQSEMARYQALTQRIQSEKQSETAPSDEQPTSVTDLDQAFAGNDPTTNTALNDDVDPASLLASLPDSPEDYNRSEQAVAPQPDSTQVAESDNVQNTNATATATATDLTTDVPNPSGNATDLASGPSISSAPTTEYKFDGETQQHTGIVLGIGLGCIRGRDVENNVRDHFFLRPGDDVTVAFPGAGAPPRAIDRTFTIVDFYESKMSEYDSTFAFIPIEALQRARGMIDPVSKIGAVSSLQIKLKKGVDLAKARDALRDEFPPESLISVNSWKDTQGPLLAAVAMETTILNILLFMIIAVAGFGILATFFMIVVEKTRDIGVLKSLGAPGTGIAAIFLGYGVLLGTVGAGVGLVAGLLFVWKINEIARVVEFITGREVFDPTIYYFDKIPTVVHPSMLVWVTLGSILIAVLASVLPSLRAARMHPVEALRYE